MSDTHEIELIEGHTDKKGVAHRRVVFGHRLTGKDLFLIQDHPSAKLATQFNDLILRAAITQFGTLPMPVALGVLAGLDTIDREDLLMGQVEYSVKTLPGNGGELLPDNKCNLAFGFKAAAEGAEDLRYTMVEFGSRITGNDQVEADRAQLEGQKRACFLAGKQVLKIWSVEAFAECAGPIPLQMFEQLDAADIFTMLEAAESWRQTFRFRGTAVPGNGRGEASGAAGAETRMERSRDSGAVAAAY